MAFGALALASATAQPEHFIEEVEEVVDIGDFWWVSSAGLVTITSYVGTAMSIDIPSQIEGMPVTGIGARAFATRRIAEITIPNSVTHIGELAFAFNELVDITIPGNVNQIGNNAFANNRLTSITIPESVIHIGNRAFANNTMVTDITIGDGVGFLYEGVFENSLRHARISIGANVELHSSGPSSLVWTGFRAAYEGNGHRAGIYTLNPNTRQWYWQAR
ncbi:MAG: leucine-rich repeat domain-containing protein [Treponema sp.]|nr:leucine-rich repeat domain-containing protein [Treponema sp.]